MPLYCQVLEIKSQLRTSVGKELARKFETPQDNRASQAPSLLAPCHTLEGGEERAQHKETVTVLFLSAHHSEKRCKCRDDNQRHRDGHSSDGSSPRRVHWEISKRKLLNLSSKTGSQRGKRSFSPFCF